MGARRKVMAVLRLSFVFAELFLKKMGVRRNREVEKLTAASTV